MFYVFLGDDASHITQYPTVSTPYPTPVSTYSEPSATPNSIPSDIFKRIDIWTVITSYK